MFRSVRFKLMVVYLLLILFAMQLIGAYFIQSLNKYFVDNYTKTIAHEAMFLASVVNLPQANTPVSHNSLQTFIKPFSEFAGAKVYVLDKDGTVVGTSGNPYVVGQKRVDPEVNGALLGLQTQEIALNPANKQRELYLAVPIHTGNSGNAVKGAVEIVAPMNGVYHSVSRIIIILATGTFLALGLSALLTVIISRTITGPISAVTRTARALAGGDFDQEVDIYSNDEIGELAATFNMLTRRLKQATRNTEREKRRLQAVLSTMRDGVLATNSNQSVVLVNPAAIQLLQTNNWPLGSNVSSLLPGEFPAGESRVIEYNGKVLAVFATALAKPNELIPEGTNLVNFISEEVDPQGGMVYVLRDVTEETQLEEARKRFVADVSHELRTPITILRSYLEALLDGAYKEEEISLQFLHVMDGETERMSRLIQELLQLSRLDSGYEIMRKERILSTELINSLAERFALLAFQSSIRFITDISDPVWVSVDKDRFNQVMDNIISNSLKYTPQNGIIRVKVHYDKNRKKAVFALKDNGSGIPELDMAHIFDRFYRVDKARSRQLGGTGLGLSIAKEIIRAHDGEISITSQIGAGTEVIITLPAEEGEKR